MARLPSIAGEMARKHGAKTTATLALVYVIRELLNVIESLTEQIDFLTRLVDATCK